MQKFFHDNIIGNQRDIDDRNANLCDNFLSLAQMIVYWDGGY